MKYCKKCKRLHNGGDEKCSVCGRPLAKITDSNTPVYLITASGFELQRIKTALEDNGVPCDTISLKRSYSAEAVTGYDTGEYDLLVPYSAYERSCDICVGIGAIHEDGEEIVEGDPEPAKENVKSLDEQFEEMSGAKRTTVRIVSAILFILLIAAVIYGTDFITALIKGIIS